VEGGVALKRIAGAQQCGFVKRAASELKADW
jgi:hypothetical protein